MKRVFIAGASRTGSMWTYNVTRSLIISAGLKLLPEDIPLTETKIMQEAFTAPARENTVYCIKTHYILRNDIPKSKIITNYRDVRDSMYSYLKFVHLDTVEDVFQVAKDVARAQMAKTDYYFTQHRDNLRIKYDDIIYKPLNTIQQINEYLGLNIELGEMQRIEENFTREKVGKLLEALKNISISDQDIKAESAKSAGYELIKNHDGSYRVFDRKTAFQTDHISPGTKGEWRDFFTPGQQKELNEMVGEWLNTYGFPV